MCDPPTFRGHYTDIPTGGKVIPDDNDHLSIRCVMRTGAMFPRPSEVGGERLRPSDIVPVLTRGLESGEGTLTTQVRGWPLVNY